MTARRSLLFVALLAGCSFDPTGASGLGGGGGDGEGSADGGGNPADSAPGAPDAANAPAADAADTPAPDAEQAAMGAERCTPTGSTPDLDGEPLGPWLDAVWYQFASSDAELVTDQHANYTFDGELRFACLHDDDKVYFFLEVTDDEIVTDSLSLREDDAVVLFLDGDGDRSGTYATTDHAVTVTAAPTTEDYGPGTLVPAGVRLLTNTGYNLEIAFEKPDIADPLPSVLGFNVALIDDDGLGNNDRDVFALRYVPSPPACTTCCDGQAEPWCDTSVSGTLTLE